MSDRKPTQNEIVLAMLREAGEVGITPLDALRHAHSLRLGARIYDLRKDGHDIRAEIVEVPGGAHVARYTIHEAKPMEQAKMWGDL